MSIPSCLLLALSLLFGACQASANGGYRQVVKQYEGMVEVGGYNRGPFIDTSNRRYAYLAAPYCASCGSRVFDLARVIYPAIRSGAAKAFLRATDKLDARLVWLGKAAPPTESVAIFTRPGGGGHFAFFIAVCNAFLRLFEFNTSPPGGHGSQHDGAWSGYRDRAIRSACSPYNSFRIVAFVRVRYAS